LADLKKEKSGLALVSAQVRKRGKSQAGESLTHDASDRNIDVVAELLLDKRALQAVVTKKWRPAYAEVGGGNHALGSNGFGATRLRADPDASGDMSLSAAARGSVLPRLPNRKFHTMRAGEMGVYSPAFRRQKGDSG
jgi:hypothetical protein